MNNTSLISKEMVEKYQNKTIRVNRCVYRIDVYDQYERLIVDLVPVNPHATIASSNTSRSSYGYEMGGRTYRKAVDTAIDIAEEIETGIKTDYIVKE